MRRQYAGLLGILALGVAGASQGCGSDSTPGNGTGGSSSGTGGASSKGGTTGSAGTTGTAGTAPTCTSVSACGGDVVGTWNVTSSCLALSGNMDVSQASLGCATVPVTGSLQTTGTYTANADHSFVDNTTTTGSAQFPLAPGCLSISSVPVTCATAASIFTALGWSTAVCTETNGQCNCSLTVTQAGGLGYISGIATKSGGYQTSGSTLSTDDGLKYAYCASGDKLTVTPQLSALSGTIVLQKTGMAGMGGATGSGGASSMGGATAMGGKSAGGANSGGAGGAGPSGGSPGQGGTSASGGAGGATGGAGGGTGTTGPCDIYAAANTPCVAAHSTIRALLAAYNGPLYQVKRGDGMTKDIPTLGPGGFADSNQQETFCMGSTCVITKLYDQSGHGNFVEAETKDSEDASVRSMNSQQTAASATKESLMVSGHKVYSLYLNTSQAYWRDGSKSGMPLADAPQGIYMVASGKHFNSGCCNDYGNGETSRTYVAGNTMDALYFGSCTIWGTGNGSGPWVMADLEGGLFSHGGGGKNDQLISQTSTYVTAMEKNNGKTQMSLKAADATAPTLNTYYQGALPPGKSPGQKQGSIVLGSGGDCCYSNNTLSAGTFYEGAIVAGYPSDETDNKIHANVVSTKYGQ